MSSLVVPQKRKNPRKRPIFEALIASTIGGIPGIVAQQKYLAKSDILGDLGKIDPELLAKAFGTYGATALTGVSGTWLGGKLLYQKKRKGNR